MIHQYKMKDLNIVLDINSGAVHVVDDCTYKVIELIDNNTSESDVYDILGKDYSEDAIREVLKEVKALTEQNQLFYDDAYEKVMDSFEDRETVVKALCLHIAHDCNLACKYCFAGEGEYHGDRSMMSLEVGKKALDFLVNNSGNRKNLEVDFFGGEPLMNFEVVKELVCYGRGLEKEWNKKFRFTITTNGVLLDDEIMAFCNEHMHNVVLSVDGRPSTHNRMRPTPNGKGSYDLIMDKFKKLAEDRNQMDYYVRGTFTAHNTDFAADVLHLADEGFQQISVEPVVASEEMDYALKEEHLPQLIEQYEILADKMLEYRKAGKAFNFFHFMIDLTGGPCVSKRLTGCGAGFEYLAVTPWGDLYPCHQFVGMEEFKMGDVENGVVNLDMQREFKGCHVYSKSACKECWAKFYCSGGCNANAYNFKNDIHSVYEVGCELEKKRVECAIYLKAKEMLGEE